MRPARAFVLALSAALMLAAPAGATHRPHHLYCGEGVGAGPVGEDGHTYRDLHTHRLSCRKALRIARAFYRRVGPPSDGRVNGKFSRYRYRCIANFRTHPEGVTYGVVACRRNGREVEFFGAGPSDPGEGGGGGGLG
jgi:hypothetical protein